MLGKINPNKCAIQMIFGKFGERKKLCVTGIHHKTMENICIGCNPTKGSPIVVNYPLEEMYARRIIRLVPGIQVDSAVQSWLNELVSNVKSLVELRNMEDYTAEYYNGERLYPFQRVDVEFMSRVPFMLNANQMGTGKTIETAGLINKLQPKSVLCLVTKTKLHDWKEDLLAWTNYKDITVIEGNTKQKEKAILSNDRIKIMTHASLRFKAKTMNAVMDKGIYSELYLKRWDLIVVDEAHRYKNSDAMQTKGARLLMRDRMVLLTGTPILNSPKDLWSLLNMLYPQRFTSYWTFAQRFCELEENPFSPRPNVTGIKNEEALQYTLLSFTTRRLKSEIMPWLPDKIYKTVKLRMSGEQLKMYRQMEREMTVDFPDGEELCAPSTMAQLLRLRQISLSPRLVGGEDEGIKTEALMDLVDKVIDNGEKVVIFSYFKEYLTRVSHLLSNRRITHGKIWGGIPTKEREEHKHNFLTNPECQALLCSIRAGGEGLNLQVASTVIFTDKDWTPGIIEQCEDRVHRDGQLKNPLIISLKCLGSIDDDIEEVLQIKDKMATAGTNLKQVIAKMISRRNKKESDEDEDS